jgi:hypothetical protein
MPFDLNKEKMLCLMELDDALAPRLSSTAGSAFWRAFILEDRTTHQVYAQFRFRYEDGVSSWFELQPKNKTSVEAAAGELRCGLEDVIKAGLAIFGVEAAVVENAIHCHYRPTIRETR